MATDGHLSLRENQKTVSRHTRRQHDELLEAIHRLEASLGSPAPGRERQWAARAAYDLRAVRQALERHVHAAEGPSGLLAELDITRPRTASRVEALRQEHRDLLQKVNLLQEGLAPRSTHDFAALRQQAEQFLAAIRSHHAREVDLIYECFWLDIGVGD